MTHGSADIEAKLTALHEQSAQHRDDARRAAEAAHAELLSERDAASDVPADSGESAPPNGGPLTSAQP